MTTTTKNLGNKITSEKEIKNKKEEVIKKRKEEIKNSENSIFENSDFLSLEKKIFQLKVKEKTNNERKLMYKFEKTNLSKEETKKLRSKMRNIRNKFANNVILYFQKKEEINLKKEVNLFKEFYLKNYILNDYSLISISSNNRDKDTTEILTNFLEIVKLFK